MKNKLAYILPAVIFLVFSIIWLHLRQLDLESTRNARQLWGATYQIIALYGAITGFFISKKWGGYRSMLGRSIMFFSIGLLLQCIGQTYSSYYVYHYAVESPPYPAIGDIGFMGSVFAYIYGAYLMSKVSGAGVRLKKSSNKIIAFLLVFLILSISYFFFLKDYSFDWSQKLKVLLDFMYPVGQAMYVSVAFLALFMSWNVLGGIMKRPILCLIFALLFQYFSDFFFLYQAGQGNWYVGNINDYVYCVSYFLMAISLIQLGNAFKVIQNS
jgi:hypothetical protein